MFRPYSVFLFTFEKVTQNEDETLSYQQKYFHLIFKKHSLVYPNQDMYLSWDIDMCHIPILRCVEGTTSCVEGTT